MAATMQEMMTKAVTLPLYCFALSLLPVPVVKDPPPAISSILLSQLTKENECFNHSSYTNAQN